MIFPTLNPDFSCERSVRNTAVSGTFPENYYIPPKKGSGARTFVLLRVSARYEYCVFLRGSLGTFAF